MNAIVKLDWMKFDVNFNILGVLVSNQRVMDRKTPARSAAKEGKEEAQTPPTEPASAIVPAASSVPKPSSKSLPVLPRQEAPQGVLGVDTRGTRVVYLAPLSSVSKEIYLAKHRDGSDRGNQASNNAAEESRSKTIGSPVDQIVRRVLCKPRSLEALSTTASGSVPADGCPLSPTSPSRVLDLPSPTKAPATENAEEEARTKPQDGIVNHQMRAMKRQIRLLPVSTEDKQSFWETIQSYRQLSRANANAANALGSDPVRFNLEAARDRELLRERHLRWSQDHNAKMEATLARKVVQDALHEQRMLESSSGFRAEVRVRLAMRTRLIAAAQNLLPIVILSAFTQRMLESLRLEWSNHRLRVRVAEIVRFWRQKRRAHLANTDAVNVLIDWLQSSVSVRTIGYRVFQGVRIFLRRIKKLQCMWRGRLAKRQLQFLYVEKRWIEEEETLVDDAIEAYENYKLKLEAENNAPKSEYAQKPRRKHKKNRHADAWMTFVSEAVRSQVIAAFVREVEAEFSSKFREQEANHYPQLVQTLRGEHPNRARSYIKAVAANLTLTGRVYSTLARYPGAVGDDTKPIEPFDIHNTPVRDLILRGRAICKSNEDARKSSKAKNSA